MFAISRVGEFGSVEKCSRFAADTGRDLPMTCSAAAANDTEFVNLEENIILGAYTDEHGLKKAPAGSIGCSRIFAYFEKNLILYLYVRHEYVPTKHLIGSQYLLH